MQIKKIAAGAGPFVPGFLSRLHGKAGEESQLFFSPYSRKNGIIKVFANQALYRKERNVDYESHKSNEIITDKSLLGTV